LPWIITVPPNKSETNSSRKVEGSGGAVKISISGLSMLSRQ